MVEDLAPASNAVICVSMLYPRVILSNVSRQMKQALDLQLSNVYLSVLQTQLGSRQ